MGYTTQMVYVHKFIVQISVHIVAVTLQKLQLGITDKLRQYVSAASAMLLIAVLVFCILITGFLIDQTPHVNLAFLIYGTVAQPRFVYIYVCTLLRATLLSEGISLLSCKAPLSAQFRRF